MTVHTAKHVLLETMGQIIEQNPEEPHGDYSFFLSTTLWEGQGGPSHGRELFISLCICPVPGTMPDSISVWLNVPRLYQAWGSLRFEQIQISCVNSPEITNQPNQTVKAIISVLAWSLEQFTSPGFHVLIYELGRVAATSRRCCEDYVSELKEISKHGAWLRSLCFRHKDMCSSSL